VRVRADGERIMMTGTYAFLLASQKTGRLDIGKLGPLVLKPGVYVYVGSAFGPGGLAARIGHHTQIAAVLGAAAEADRMRVQVIMVPGESPV